MLGGVSVKSFGNVYSKIIVNKSERYGLASFFDISMKQKGPIDAII